jgi:hypothetical protein
MKRFLLRVAIKTQYVYFGALTDRFNRLRRATKTGRKSGEFRGHLTYLFLGQTSLSEKPVSYQSIELSEVSPELGSEVSPELGRSPQCWASFFL